MKNNKYLLSAVLVLTIAVSLLALLLINAFFPMVTLPKFTVANLSVVSLVALVVNYYLTEEENNHLIVIAFAFVAFGLLPFVTGFVGLLDALLLAVKGTITFTAMMFVFSSIQNRLSSNGKNWFAPVMTAVMLYLAIQCLMGIV